MNWVIAKMITVEDNRYDYGEERFATLGLLYSRVVMIIHTERADTIRIISMRKGIFSIFRCALR